MPATKGNKLYSVKVGRRTGIYNTWAECEAAVKGYPGAQYKSFKAESEARDFAGLEPSGSGSGGGVAGGNSDSAYGIGSRSHPYASASRSARGFYNPNHTSTHTSLSVESPSNSKRSSVSSASAELQPGQPINIYCDGASAGNGREVSIKSLFDESQSLNVSIEPSADPILLSGAHHASRSPFQQGSKAGYGIYFEHPSLQHLNQSSRLSGKVQTNNRAELTGILKTLTSPEVSTSSNPLVIHSDSKYSIDSIENWSKNWRRNGWKNSKGEEVMNKDLIRSIGAELKKRENDLGADCRPRFVHVKGHDGIHGNEMADKLATTGAQLPAVDGNALDEEPPDSDSEDYMTLVRKR